MKNLFAKIKSHLRLSPLRRIVILGATSVAAILAIALGSAFYTTNSSNVSKSSEFAAAAHFEIKAEKPRSSKVTGSEMAEEIYNRIDPLGLKGIKVTPVTRDDKQYLDVEYPNISTKTAMDEVEYDITHKPKLTFTTMETQPIFSASGSIDQNIMMALATQSQQLGKTWDFNNWDESNVNDSKVPLAPGSARVVNQNGEFEILMDFKDQNAVNDFTTANAALAQLKQTDPAKATGIELNKMVVWFDLDAWIKGLQNVEVAPGQTLWDQAQYKPYNALFLNNDPTSGHLRNSDAFLMKDADKYKVAELKVDSATSNISGRSLVIKGGFSAKDASEIAKKINFSTVTYNLSVEPNTSKIVAPSHGGNAFKYFIIWGAVSFSLIALALMVSYGLLGALSTIALALFAFITLTLFTVMRGEYSPQSIAALLVGFGLILDANISILEKFKREVSLGHTLKRSMQAAHKKSLGSIVDSNIVTLIVLAVLFYFGTRSIIGFSLVLVLSIMLTIVISLVFTRIVMTLLIGSEYFDKKQKLLRISQKTDDLLSKSLSNADFVKKSKWSFASAMALIFAGIMVVAVLGGTHHNFGDGFASSSNLTRNMVVDSAIAISIAIAFIWVYTMIRFRWTYALALIILMIQDLFLVLAIYAIARIRISPSTLAALLGIVALSLNNKITLFDSFKVQILTKYELDQVKITQAANDGVKNMFRRNVLFHALMIVVIVILMAFNSIIYWQASLALLLGVIFTAFTSFTIAPWLWVKFEIIRLKGIESRKKHNFWKTKGVEEQTISGINDFQY